jgi:hypothetical protein
MKKLNRERNEIIQVRYIIVTDASIFPLSFACQI